MTTNEDQEIIMSEPLLKIRNNHVPGCGDPPIVTNDDPALYVGYFENAYREQWVFTFNRKTKRGELRIGDEGWTEVFEVRGGRVPGMVLGHDESTWLSACWRAANGETAAPAGQSNDPMVRMVEVLARHLPGALADVSANGRRSQRT